MRALLMQVLYSIRRERMLMEQISYTMLFRWFVGLQMHRTVSDHSAFSKNRDRLPANVFHAFQSANSAIACSVARHSAASPARPGFAACLQSIRSVHGRKHRSATIVGFPALLAPRQPAGRASSYCGF